MKSLSRKEEAMYYFFKAYEHQMSERYDSALFCYRKSIEIFPTAEAYTYLGWTYSFMGDLDRAIEECKRAIQVDPDFGNPYNDIASYLIEKGSLDDALPYLNKALKAKRYQHQCFPHYNMGRIWEKKGIYGKAIRWYQRALDANPKYSPANIALKRLQGMFN